ncbi:MAG: hypothetical protein AAF725_17330 [Acidobacteriota bacterium]
MWTLIKSQLEYSKRTVFFLWFAALCVGLPATLMAGHIEDIFGLWRVLVGFGGCVLAIKLYSLDLKERRLLLWMALPIAPWRLGLARVLLPMALQASLLLPFFLSSPLWPSAAEGAAVAAAPGAAAWLILRVLAVQGLILIVVMMCYFVEEFCLVLSPWRWAVVVLNLAFGVPVGWFLLNPDRVISNLYTWPGVAVAHALALALAASTLWLFTRRRSYLMGINPWHGMPVDWTRE